MTGPRPEPTPDLLDTGGVAPDLERLASAAARGDGAEVIERAKLVLGRLRIARAATGLAARSDAPRAWHAARVREGTRARDAMCWTVGPDPGVSVYGRWIRKALQLVHVQAGDRFWAMRQTATGESFLSTDESIEGPADRKLFEDVARRIRDEPARWEEPASVGEWTCPRCSWTNTRPGPCEFCGIAGDPWSVDPPSARHMQDAVPRVGGSSADLELLDGYEALLDKLVADLTGMPAPVRPPGPQTDDDSVAGSIVLEGFDRSHHAAVIRAVVEARKMSGDEPADLVHVTSLVEEAAPVICTGIAARQAATVQRWLARAGAETRFRRDA